MFAINNMKKSKYEKKLRSIVDILTTPATGNITFGVEIELENIPQLQLGNKLNGAELDIQNRWVPS